MVECLYHLITENHENNNDIELKIVPNKNDYVISEKLCLKNNMTKSAYRLLVAKGLYKNIITGENKFNSKVGIHRLCCCMYDDITGKVIHHIDKNKKFNCINNLLPVKDDEIHTILDHYDEDKKLVRKLHKQFKHKVFKKHKTTVASNDDLILQILQLKEQGFSVKEIIKYLDNKIKKSSVYKILKEFYYRKEFLEYLQNEQLQAFSEFNGKNLVRWQYINAFESS